MSSNFIDNVVALRQNFNAWLAEFSTPMNIIYVLYVFYLVGVILYMLDAAEVGRKMRDPKLPNRALGSFIIFHIVVYGLMIAGIFFFPESSYTAFLNAIVDRYPLYPYLSLGLILIVAVVAYLVGMTTSRMKSKEPKQ